MLDLVLCVDDDPITLMLCKMVINKSEITKNLITAENGEDALNYFDDLKLNNLGGEISSYPQLIFLDLNMPVMGGWEFLDHFSQAEYRELFKDCKVIVLSSTIDPEDINKAKTYPMVLDFMSKPISKEMLEDLKKIL
ncbi:response regulator [Flavobacterium sp. CYK-55]|uniref:response regulator n=1 Tax=Flavobacterium sp. CYK-55 TaxID=2835529 RepID=UPI001BCCEE18|nr:response regulator [Flavobacterium sp. CYK-55]MBS7786244.1 response regulator [Flavobacterium sp. CYK-55]